MATTIAPLPSGGPLDEGEDLLLYPPDTGTGMASFVRPLLESKKTGKSIMKAAEGMKSVKGSKPKKVKKPKLGKNLATEAGIKNKKRGPFGETYQPVQAGQNKGVRVAESNRFRESVSAEDLRGMIQRALRTKFPPPPPGSFSGYPGEVGSNYSSPWIKDVFPEDHMVVFQMNEVLWGADFTVNERSGAAKLSNVRRVKVEYADFDEESEKTKESKFGESVFGKKRKRFTESEVRKAIENEVSPPGMEHVVKKLKKQPGVENPWAVAWNQYGK